MHKTPLEKKFTTTTKSPPLKTKTHPIKTKTIASITTRPHHSPTPSSPKRKPQRTLLRTYFGVTKPYHDDDERRGAPSTSRMIREMNRTHASLKLFIAHGDGESLVSLASSPEFIRLKTIIQVAEEQTYRVQASESRITIGRFKEWLDEQSNTNPDIPYYSIIKSSIPKNLPALHDNDDVSDVDDMEIDLDDELFMTGSYLKKIEKQNRIAKQRTNQKGSEWILRPLFWKQQSGFASPINIPIEWAQLIGCVSLDKPFIQTQGLSAIAAYVKFCGLPMELYNIKNQSFLSQCGNDPDVEIVNDIVDNVIRSSPVLRNELIASNSPDSRFSIISKPWYQNLTQMATFVLAFENRLNQYQQDRVGLPHIPFATILSKHFDSSGNPLYRPGPKLSGSKSDMLLEFAHQQRESHLERTPEGIEEFAYGQHYQKLKEQRKQDAKRGSKDPFLLKQRYNAFLGGKNLPALSTSLQLDDLYMLTALCGEVLNKFNGVSDPRGVEHDPVPFVPTFHYQDMKKLLQRVMIETNLDLERESTAKQSLLDEKMKKLATKEKKEKKETNLDEFDNEYDSEDPDQKTDEKKARLAALEVELKALEEKTARGESSIIDDSSNTLLRELIDENINQMEKEKNEKDEFPVQKNVIYVPGIATHFVNPIDDSRSFVRGFTNVDINDFLHDETLIEALSEIKDNQLKNVLNFKLMRSANWLKLDLIKINKGDLIGNNYNRGNNDNDDSDDYGSGESSEEIDLGDELQQYGPLDVHDIHQLGQLSQIYPNMLVQNGADLSNPFDNGDGEGVVTKKD
jgi:hypothetical protein